MQDAVYHDLFDSAPDGIIIVDTTGRIAMVNAETERMFGYAKSELIGRPIEVLVPARYRTVHNLHREDYGGHPRARPMGAGLQLMAKRKDGTEFPVEISLSPVATSDGPLITAVVRDTTERRRSEDAIRSQAQLLDLAQDAIIVLDGERRIQYWNSGAELTYGWTADEVLGKKMEEFLQTAFSEPRERVMQSLEHTGSWEGELQQTKQSGRRVTVASRMVVQRGADGAITSTMQIDRDITERRTLERERERLMLEAERQQDRARIGMDLHDGIIQSIYAVSLGLEAVAEDVASDPAGAQTGVNAAIDHLSSIIRDIRSYIFELRPSQYSSNLSTSLERMVAEFEKGSAMHVDTSIEHGLPELSEDEGMMLFHIAREALTNARKHASARHLSVTLSQDEGVLRLQVSDDGVGFPPDDPAGENQHGLRNMRRRATAIGATLDIASGKGEGTTLTVSLPLHEREGIGV